MWGVRLPLWGSWRAKARLRGQARHERTAHAAISRLFVRAILSLRPQIIVSILALSVTYGDTSPKGRGFRYSAGPSLFDERLPLWGSWRAKARLRGQARHERTVHAAISRLFVRAMLSLRLRITVSILALSVTFGDTSPKGRGFVKTGKVCKNCKTPLQTSPRCGIIHLAASPLRIEYLPL